MTGKDAILAGPALNALENSYAALTKDFQIKPDDKVLVEVYPDFEAFTHGTGLTMEELENSGTIAICKYKRMMIRDNYLFGYYRIHHDRNHKVQ